MSPRKLFVPSDSDAAFHVAPGGRAEAYPLVTYDIRALRSERMLAARAALQRRRDSRRPAP